MPEKTITSHFRPNYNLETLVREAVVKARNRPMWDSAMDEIESFCNLTQEETAWLAGIRWMGNYVRSYV